MLGEINSVLNEICPANHTMIIDALELNIGMLNYHNLQEELPKKFTETLRNSLYSLINSSISNEEKLRIVTKDQIYIEMIQDFLKFGYFPKGLNENENLHKIINRLLKNNSIEVIKLIRSLIKHENIRKRIAWQFEEKTIKKILQELEPSNYNYVISFSEDIIQIQKKEAILKTSIIDFKKNLWLWIFNYLFLERGTMFNKTAFAKSALMQMAQHFNLEYNQLFELIEEAVSKVKHSRKNELLIIIKTISNQRSKDHFFNKATTRQTENYWDELETFLSKKSTRSLTKKKTYFNELVINLYKANTSRFTKLLLNVGFKEDVWCDIASDLTELSLEIIFIGLNPSNGEKIIAEISSLEALRITEVFNISKKRLISIGLSYASQTTSKIYTQKSLLDFVLSNLKGKDSKIKQQFFQVFLNSDLSVEKSKNMLSTWNGLDAIYKKELLNKDSSFKQERLIYLLDNINVSNQKELILLLHSESDFVSNLFKIENKYFENLIYKLDSKELQNIFDNIHGEYSEIVNNIKKAVTNLEKSHPNNSIYSKLKELIIPSAFTVLKQQNLVAHSEFILSLCNEVLWKALSSKKDEELLTSVHNLLKHSQLKNTKLESNDYSKLITHANHIESKTLFDVCLDKIKNNYTKKEEVMKRVYCLLHSHNIKEKELQRNESLLVKYVFGIQILQKDKTFKEFKQETLNSYKNINLQELDQFLDQVYWKSLCQYTIHKGNINKWVDLLQELVANRFLEQEENFIKTESDLVYKKDKITIKDLEESLEAIHRLIQKTKDKESLIKLIGKEISVQQFNTFISNVVSRKTQNYLKASFLIFQILATRASQREMRQLNKDFWQYTIDLIKGRVPGKLLRELIDSIIEIKNQDPNFDKDDLVEAFVSHDIQKLIHLEGEGFLENEMKSIKDLKECIEQKTIENLIEFVMEKDEIPVWYYHQNKTNIKSLIEEILILQPHKMVKTLRNNKPFINKFLKICSATQILEKLEYLYVHQSSVLNGIKKLYLLFGSISIKQISGKTLQDILLKKVIGSWVNSNWNQISESKIWIELLWEINKKQSLSQKEFIDGLNPIKTSLPASFLTTLNLLEEVQKSKVLESKVEPSSLSKGISIPNAGLVILNTYFKMLFERLEIISDNKFVSIEDQLKAVHYLQFIVTGYTKTEEHLLVLNKVLCGLDPTFPIKEEIEMSDNEKELINGMISSSITHWSSLGGSSIDGFRGNWLVRDGVLREEEDRWMLIVEKRSYDILMHKSPFSFSIIKLPWMKKPMHIQWPF
jgi:hypothetical protein